MARMTDGMDNTTEWYDYPLMNVSKPPTDPVETQNILIMGAIGKWVMIILLPVIFLLGVVGNILSIVVFIRGAWSHGTMPIYLVTLAITDTSVLVISIMGTWVITLFGLDISASSNLACKVFIFAGYVLHYFSSWIIVSITTERAIVIIFPHGWTCTRRKAKLVLIVLGVFLCGVCSHLIYGFSLIEIGYCDINTTEYRLFFNRIWSRIDLFIRSVVPSAILFVANAAIIWRIRRNARNLSEFTSCTRGNNRGTGQASSETTKILIVLSVVYVVTTLPLCVMIIIGNNWREPMDDVSFAKLNLAHSITHVLGYCNNAANFYLYCLSGSTFRRQLSLLIPCCRPCHRQHHDNPHATRTNQGTELSVITYQQVG